jgi:hypothetical protein
MWSLSGLYLCLLDHRDVEVFQCLVRSDEDAKSKREGNSGFIAGIMGEVVHAVSWWVLMEVPGPHDGAGGVTVP